VSVQMFHLQCLSVPMLLQTGEMDCNNTWRESSSIWLFRDFTDLYKGCLGINHLSWHSRQRTNTGSISLSMRASMGGLRSEDRSFRADWTAFSWTAGLSLPALATNSSRFAVARFLSKSSSSEISKGYCLLGIMSSILSHDTSEN
jgi:hypothetical protein